MFPQWGFVDIMSAYGPWLSIPVGVHAVVTAAVVIVTANHWWLDAVLAIALFALALLAFPASGKCRLAALVARPARN